MIETAFGLSEVCRLFESAILNCEQLRTVLQKNPDHSLRVSFPRFRPEEGCGKKRLDSLIRTFLRCSMTVLAYSLATSSQKYLV